MQKFYLSLYCLLAVAPLWAQTSPAINTFPTREFGQPALLPSLNSVAPNLVEGREVYQPLGVAFDTSVTPPIMYIADTGNNRVLAYPNPGNLGVCTVSNSTCGFASPIVLGQRDLTSTLPGGPGAPGLTYGFTSPTSLAVDAKGNVYVVDSGNNRVLRFPAPFKQPSGALLTPDLIIGQTSLSGNSINQGQSLPSAQTLALTSGSNASRTGIAIEPATGGLWVTDAYNNRVLRFPASQLTAYNVAPTADVVLGQNSFTAGTLPTPPTGIQAPLATNILNQPAALAFDQNGNLYVSDYYNRVVYFVGPFGTGTVGLSGTRVLGLYVQLQGSTQTAPNQYSLLGPPGLAVSSTNHLWVADVGYNRIGEYDLPTNWPAAPPATQTPITSQFSPPMIAILGQNNDFSQVKANKGNPTSDNSTLSDPIALAFLGTDLWVADTGNNRVMDFVQQGTSYTTASRLVGQLDFPYDAPNLIEGREVYLAGSGGVAVDHSASTPHLYIADTFNNRILGFKDARNIQAGQKADLVLGQTDFYSALINSPTNINSEPTQTGLFRPIGVVVDSSGNLYVSDSGNGRVVRYAAPFNQPAGAIQLPNLVLGQASFNFTITDASASNMHTPYGVALFTDGSLGVSDFYHNRVLIFKHAAGADFTNGQAASIVLGQQTTTAILPSSAAAGMAQPAHIAVDTSNRLYVADSANNRMLVFNSTTNLATGATSSNQFLNFSTPLGIAVSSNTGEIWIANYGNNTVYRLPEYDTLILNSTPTTYPTTATIQPQTPGLALALDDADNLIVAENANRITFFFAQLVYSNAANYNSQPIAPGMLVLLARVGLSLQITNGSAQTLPWQATMNDVQVAVNGVPAPIYAIASGYISIQVPSGTPSSGNASFIVSHPSTGEIIAVGSFPMAPYSPGFFTQGALGAGQIAAVNDDGTVNSASNQVSRDGTHFISFYLTGGGVFSGGPNPAPADGAAPTQTASTAIQPTMLAAAYAGQIPAANILYSGAGGGYPGLWQVSMKVTTTFAPSAQQIVTLTMNGVPTSQGPSGTISTWFAAK